MKDRGVVRLKQTGKIHAGILRPIRIEVFRRRIVGHRYINRAAKVVCFLQPLLGLAQQKLIVPPQTRIDGNVTLKNWRLTQQSIRGQKSSKRMTHENPMGQGTIIGLDMRDEFVLEKIQESFPTSTGGEGWFLFSAFTLGRVGWCQVASSERIRNRYHDHLRNLGIAIVSIAHKLHYPAGGMKVGVAIQNVEHKVFFGGEKRVLVRLRQIHPEIPVLMEDIRMKSEPLPNFVFLLD